MSLLSDLLAQYTAAHALGEYDDEYERISEEFDAELRRCQVRTDEPGSLTDLIRQYGDACANEVAAGEHGSHLEAQTYAANAEMLLDQIRAVSGSGEPAKAGEP